MGYSIAPVAPKQIELIEYVEPPLDANQVRLRTLEMVEQHSDIYEYYNPLTGMHPPKAAGMFGWTSAVYIDLAIQAANERA
jgi:hypothetical protein